MMLLKQIGGQENINEKTPIIVVESGGSRFIITEVEAGKIKVERTILKSAINSIQIKQSKNDVEIY